MSPDVAPVNPAIIESKVDLPHPDGPKIETNSPFWMDKSMLFRTVFGFWS